MAAATMSFRDQKAQISGTMHVSGTTGLTPVSPVTSPTSFSRRSVTRAFPGVSAPIYVSGTAVTRAPPAATRTDRVDALGQVAKPGQARVISGGIASLGTTPFTTMPVITMPATPDKKNKETMPVITMPPTPDKKNKEFNFALDGTSAFTAKLHEAGISAQSEREPQKFDAPNLTSNPGDSSKLNLVHAKDVDQASKFTLNGKTSKLQPEDGSQSAGSETYKKDQDHASKLRFGYKMGKLKLVYGIQSATSQTDKKDEDCATMFTLHHNIMLRHLAQHGQF